MIDYNQMIKDTESNGFNVRDDLKHNTYEELRKMVDNDRLPFSVCCLNITGSLNVGVIIRTSHALGAKRVIVLGRRKIDNRSCVGSHKYMDVIKVDAIDDNGEIDENIFEETMKKYFLFPLYVETGGYNYYDFNWKYVVEKAWLTGGNNICLVMGNEGLGIPKKLIKSRSNIVSIPQRGVIRSINVSSAFSIVCSHMVNKLWGNV